MCVGQQFRTHSAAVNYLNEARKSLRGCQYQKCFDKLEQAERLNPGPDGPKRTITALSAVPRYAPFVNVGGND